MIPFAYFWMVASAQMKPIWQDCTLIRDRHVVILANAQLKGVHILPRYVRYEN